MAINLPQFVITGRNFNFLCAFATYFGEDFVFWNRLTPAGAIEFKVMNKNTRLMFRMWTRSKDVFISYHVKHLGWNLRKSSILDVRQGSKYVSRAQYFYCEFRTYEVQIYLSQLFYNNSTCWKIAKNWQGLIRNLKNFKNI